MSNYNQNQAQAYPPPGTAYPTTAAVEGYPQAQGGYMAPPPPAGYPTKDGQQGYPQHDPASVNTTTQSRGDGFWKGCCAALCCCCLLDACF